MRVSAASVVAEAASLFDALGDPNRMVIVTRLADGGPASTSRVAQGIPVTRQAVTKHLLALEAVGLVRSEKLGRERVWTMRTQPLTAASDYLVALSRRRFEEANRTPPDAMTLFR